MAKTIKEFERGVDYIIKYSTGEVLALKSGRMSYDVTYEIEYDVKLVDDRKTVREAFVADGDVYELSHYDIIFGSESVYLTRHRIITEDYIEQ